MERHLIDLVRTVAPSTPGLRERLSHALATLSADQALADLVRLHRGHGDIEERTWAGRWLGPRLGHIPEPDRVLLTSGVQLSLLVLLAAMRAKGRAVLSEALTYTPVDQVCSWLELCPHLVEMDAEGLVPEALEAACRSVGPAVLYCNPTLHNPTTATMSLGRRRSIAEIARAHDLILVEDDVHGLLWSAAPPPLAYYASERCWYLMTLSKCVGFGLREAILVGPSAQDVEALVASAPNFSGWFTPSLSAAVITNLIRSGEINALVGAVGEEIAARQALAQELLGVRPRLQTAPHAMHLWLQFDSTEEADRLVEAARHKGVRLRSPAFYATPARSPPAALRLSLTEARDREVLERGLAVVAALLDRPMRE